MTSTKWNTVQTNWKHNLCKHTNSQRVHCSSTTNNEQMKGGDSKRMRFAQQSSTTTAVLVSGPLLTTWCINDQGLEISCSYSNEWLTDDNRSNTLPSSATPVCKVSVYFAPRNMVLSVQKRKALEVLYRSFVNHVSFRDRYQRVESEMFLAFGIS
jgi:hypothetical protein